MKGRDFGQQKTTKLWTVSVGNMAIWIQKLDIVKIKRAFVHLAKVIGLRTIGLRHLDSGYD